MRRTRIKICGVCRAEDALAAAEIGADAVGIVLHPRSRRYVEFADAKRIVATLPAFVSSVGLFVDQPAAEIAEAVREIGLDLVQLHGDESPEAIAELRPLRVIKAIRVDRRSLEKDLGKWREAIATQKLMNLAGLVLETSTVLGPGGTGAVNDWEAIGEGMARGWLAGLPKVILAGGLNPSNVADVVKTLRPWGVDVSSGVEEALRVKSAVKLERFAAAVGVGSSEQ